MVSTKSECGPLKRVDVAAAIGGARPARRLHRAGHFQRHLVEAALPGVFRDASLGHQAEQVAVGADVVEAVIVNADVADVRRHHVDRSLAPDLQEFGVAGGIELQDGGAELEALRPLGPAAAGVLAADSEDGRTVGRGPGLFDGADFGGGQFEHPADFRRERAQGGSGLGIYHFHAILAYVHAPLGVVFRERVPPRLAEVNR